MPYQELKDYGNQSEGIHVLFEYVADVVPLFIPLLLFAFFSIMCLGNFYSEQRTRSRADFASSFAVAGWATVILAFLLALVSDLVNLVTMVVVFVVAMIGSMWLLLAQDK